MSGAQWPKWADEGRVENIVGGFRSAYVYLN